MCFFSFSFFLFFLLLSLCVFVYVYVVKCSCARIHSVLCAPWTIRITIRFNNIYSFNLHIILISTFIIFFLHLLHLYVWCSVLFSAHKTGFYHFSIYKRSSHMMCSQYDKSIYIMKWVSNGIRNWILAYIHAMALNPKAMSGHYTTLHSVYFEKLPKNHQCQLCNLQSIFDQIEKIFRVRLKFPDWSWLVFLTIVYRL